LRKTLFDLKRQILKSQKTILDAHLEHLDERSNNYRKWKQETAKMESELVFKLDQLDLQLAQKEQLIEAEKV